MSALVKENIPDGAFVNVSLAPAPNRILSVDACILCGFWFSFSKVSATGGSKEVNRSRQKHKRKLTKEVVDIIKKVLPDFSKCEGNKTGICQKCLTSATKITKMERNIQKLKQDMYESWIQMKIGVRVELPMATGTGPSFKKSESVPFPKRVDAPFPPRGEERSVYIPWGQTALKRSNDMTKSAPTGHMDSNFESFKKSKSVLSPMSVDAPSSPSRGEEQSVFVPWSRSTDVTESTPIGHMDSTSERMFNKPTFLENEAMDSCNAQQERPSNDSMQPEAKHEHHTDNISLDNRDIKLEPTDSFSVKQEHHNYGRRELETNGKHNMDTITSDNCRRKLETTDSFSVKQENNNYGTRELETNGKHNMDTITSDNCRRKFEPTDSFSVKQENNNYGMSELETNGKHNMDNITSDNCRRKFGTTDSFILKQEPSNS